MQRETNDKVVARRCALTINPFTDVVVGHRVKLDSRLMLNDLLVHALSFTANLHQQDLVYDSLALVVQGQMQFCKLSCLRIYLGRFFHLGHVSEVSVIELG